MGKATILVVEDEGITAKDLQMRLQRMGYNVPDIAATGEAAIKKAREIEPDILLMDIMLAGQMNGIEAARQIRLINDIPVIYLSAFTEIMMSEDVRHTEPFGFLSKPFSDYDLQNTIAMALYKYKAEKAMKRSHERLLMVLDSLNAGVYVADMKTFEVLFVNKYTRDMFGDIEGKICWQSLQVDQTGPCSFCTNDKLLTADGRPADVYCWEFQNTINGRWYYIQDKALQWVDDRMVRLEIATDITERKWAQEQLSRSENELNSIFDAITDFLTVINTDYRIERVNRTVEKQFGKDLVGKVCYEVYQGRKEICPDCPTKKAIETKKPAFSFQSATEVSLPVDIYAYPILNKDGDVIAVVEHGKGATERKKAEEKSNK